MKNKEKKQQQDIIIKKMVDVYIEGKYAITKEVIASDSKRTWFDQINTTSWCKKRFIGVSYEQVEFFDFLTKKKI